MLRKPLGDFMPTTPRPLYLTDEQLDAVHRAATPLPPNDRSAYLQMVAELLRDEHTLGDGTVARAAATAQAYFLRPPAIQGMKGVGKYARRS